MSNKFRFIPNKTSSNFSNKSTKYITKSNNINFYYDNRRQQERRLLELEELLTKNPQKNDVFLEKNIEKYRENPEKYMDFLMELHMKELMKGEKDEEFYKERNREKYDELMSDLVSKFSSLFSSIKLHLNYLSNEAHYPTKIMNQRRLGEHSPLVSEPLLRQENIWKIFAVLPQNKYNLIINHLGDVKKETVLDKESKFYELNIKKKVVECLGGDNRRGKNSNSNSNNRANPINVPSKSFISVKDLTIKNDRKFKEEKIKFDEIKNKRIRDKTCEENIVKNLEKTVEIQKKIFDDLYEKYQNLDAEIRDKNTENERNIAYLKNNLDKSGFYDRLTHQQLGTFKSPEEQVRNIFQQNNHKYEDFNMNLSCNKVKDETKNLKEIVDREEKKADEEVEKILKKYGRKSKFMKYK